MAAPFVVIVLYANLHLQVRSKPDLRAFGGDLIGSRLPKQFQLWRAVGGYRAQPQPAA